MKEEQKEDDAAMADAADAEEGGNKVDKKEDTKDENKDEKKDSRPKVCVECCQTICPLAAGRCAQHQSGESCVQ